MLTELRPISLVRPTKPVVIYGAGAAARIIIEDYMRYGIEIFAVCDSNQLLCGTEIYGIEVFSFESIMEKTKEFCVTIAVGETYYDEVEKYLLQYIDKSEVYHSNVTSDWQTDKSEKYRQYLMNNIEKYKSAYLMLADQESKRTLENVIIGNITCDANVFREIAVPDQYFNCLTKSSQEKLYIDAGAFDGDTMIGFLEFVKNDFEKAIFFEPDSDCYQKLKMRKELLPPLISSKIELFNNALYSSDKEVCFNNIHGVASNRIDLDSTIDNRIMALALDQQELDGVSFIKMDIEGSELYALKGAEKLIQKYHPKLAICVYHEIHDFIDILEYIASLYSGYSFFLRHHGSRYVNTQYETVLYAIDLSNND